MTKKIVLTEEQAKLVLADIGWQLMSLAQTSIMLGHKKVEYTARDYYFPEEDELGALFVKDVLTRTTAEVVARWPGLDRMTAKLSQPGRKLTS